MARNLYESDPCPQCGCVARGEWKDERDGFSRYLRWDPPDLDCEHDCHEPWRIMNRSLISGPAS